MGVSMVAKEGVTMATRAVPLRNIEGATASAVQGTASAVQGTASAVPLR